MTWRPWTATDLRHLRSMIEEGCSSGTIAKALGRSRGAVCGMAHRHGMRLPGASNAEKMASKAARARSGRTPTHWPQWRVDLLRQLAAKGLSSAQVARELDVTVDAVKRKALRAGVSFSSREGGGNSTTWDDPHRLARLAELVAKGWSSNDIARDLGISRGKVLGRCRRDGLKLQSRRRKSVRADAPEVPAASNVMPLRKAVQETAPAPEPLRDPMPFLDAVFGRCRMPLWDEGRHVPIEDKFYCGAPVARSGVSWCPACLATISSQPRISLDALAFGKRARRRAFT